MFTLNSTVAFILGGLGCAGLVFTGSLPWASAFLGIAIIGLLTALAYVVVTGSTRLAPYAGLAGAAGGFLLWKLVGTGDEANASNPFEDAFATLSVQEHFQSFGEGVMRLSDLAFFVGGVAVLLYLSAFLLGRRHW
jgi:hypothetical protein